MRDRVPLLIVAALVFGALVVGALAMGSQRGDFAEALSTWRSRESGARAIYLLAQHQGLPVERRTRPLERLEPSESLVFLGVTPGRVGEPPKRKAKDADPPGHEKPTDEKPTDEKPTDEKPTDKKPTDEKPKDALSEAAKDTSDGSTSETSDGQEAQHDHADWEQIIAEGEDAEALTAARDLLYTHLEEGGRILIAIGQDQSAPLLDDLGFRLIPTDAPARSEEDPKEVRRLVPAQVTRMTRGLGGVAAPVAWTLELPEKAVPLLLDERTGHPVAAWYPTFIDDGGLLVVTAPQLFDNAHLARAENARFALSLLGWLGEGNRRIAFDEYHHGFQNQRSLSDFARRYGVHFALMQLLLGLVVWVLSLRRFGPPQPPEDEVRTGRADLLAATANLYRGGRHHQASADQLLGWLTRECAAMAGIRAHAGREEVLAQLEARGLHAVARSLTEVWTLARNAKSEQDVLATARAVSAALRAMKNRQPEAAPDAARKEAAA